MAPHVLQSISRYTVTPAGLYLAAALRIAIGVALVRVAATSRAPRVLRALGSIAIVAGLVTLFLGVDQAGAILDWWSGRGPVFIRFWSALALVFGVIIVLAVVPRQRAPSQAPAAGGDPMKAYVMTTGAVFGLLTLAHLWRIFEEGPHVATSPWYVLITVAAGALCLWAWRLVRLSTGS